MRVCTARAIAGTYSGKSGKQCSTMDAWSADAGIVNDERAARQNRVTRPADASEGPEKESSTKKTPLLAAEKTTRSGEST